MFTEFLTWLVDLDKDPKTFKIVGAGDRQLGTTAIEDIAGFTAHVLTTLPSSRLANSIFRIQGDRLTLNEAALRLANHNPELKVVHVEDVGDAFKNSLQTFVESGWADTRYDPVTKKNIEGLDGKDNELWEGHVWKTFKDVHGV